MHSNKKVFSCDSNLYHTIQKYEHRQEVLLKNQFERWLFSFLSKYTSNTNLDLLTSPALLQYFNDIFVTAKQFHNRTLRMMHYAKHMQLSSNWLSNCIYFADLTRVIYLPATPRGINYYLCKWKVTGDFVQHM